MYKELNILYIILPYSITALVRSIFITQSSRFKGKYSIESQSIISSSIDRVVILFFLLPLGLLLFLRLLPIAYLTLVAPFFTRDYVVGLAYLLQLPSKKSPISIDTILLIEPLVLQRIQLFQLIDYIGIQLVQIFYYYSSIKTYSQLLYALLFQVVQQRFSSRRRYKYKV